MHPPSRLRLLATVMTSTVILSGCGEEEVSQIPDGTARMASRLSNIAAGADPETNMYLNHQRAELYSQRLEEQRGGPATIPLHLNLGIELMYSGNARASTNQLSIALSELNRARSAGLSESQYQKARKLLHHYLTLAWLRLGEQTNCLDHQSLESCIFPIGPGGVHQEQEGASQAYRMPLETLENDPQDYEAIWLLNLVSMQLGNYPDSVPEPWRLSPDLFDSPLDIGQFYDRAPKAGVAVRGLAGGVVAEDLNGDEWIDLMVSAWGMSDPLRVFINNQDGTFEDRSDQPGLKGITGGLNLLHADYDNDGDADILVLRGGWFETDGGHPNSLLRNDGTGNFKDVTEEVGLLSFHPTQTASWDDFDGDGWLDLFIGNETGPNESHPCELFHNQGDGTFVDIAQQTPRLEKGQSPQNMALEGYIKGVAFGDYDEDGRPDLFVSRIDGPNLLLRNNGPTSGGRWSFQDVSQEAGITAPFRSFPAWWFDYNNDGHLDIFVSGFRYSSSGWVAQDYLGMDNKGVKARLYRGHGNGSFDDVTASMHLDHVFLTMGCNFGDLDEDGWLDMYLSTGEPDFQALYPNRMLRNDGGQGFQDVTTSTRMGHLQKGHGIAFSDFDNDGDQDIYAVMGGAFSGDVFPNALFENPGHDRHSLVLRLEGVRSHRSAIGTLVRVDIEEKAGTKRTIYSRVGTGGSFGSATLRREIGLANAQSILNVTLSWPSGTTQELGPLDLDSWWKVREGEPPTPLFSPPDQIKEG